jgi:hypothetical protein
LALFPVACGGGKAASRSTPTTTTAVHRSEAMTIKVTSVTTQNRAYSQSPKVRTVGDRIEFANDLRNTAPRFGKRANAKIGTDEGTITYTSKTSARMEGVATLPDGTILFKGQVTVLPNNTVTIPVVGGTGSYEDASGSLLVGAVMTAKGAKQAQNTYRLLIDSAPGPVA